MSLQNKVCLGCGCSFVDTSTRRPITYCTRKCYKTFWMSQNKKAVKRSQDNYLVTHAEKRKKSSNEYRKRNRAYYTEYASLRSRYVSQVKPNWLSEFDLLWITELYDVARLRGLTVDHIVPIKNKKVCGLHVPWNLQLLTQSENSKKSNKFYDEDIICVIKG